MRRAVFEEPLTVILGTRSGTAMQCYHRLHVPQAYRGMTAHVTDLNGVRSKSRSIGEISVPLQDCAGHVTGRRTF
jgi:hypothetical protein